jgi:hypothetical protein
MTCTIRGTPVIILSPDYNIVFLTWLMEPALTAWVSVTQQGREMRAVLTLHVSLPIISPGGCSFADYDYVS